MHVKTKRQQPMNRFFIILYLAVLATGTAVGSTRAHGTAPASDVEQAMALARRMSPALTDKVQFKKIGADRGRDVFTLESHDGKVVIGGNNAGAMAVGLNRYLNR